MCGVLHLVQRRDVDGAPGAAGVTAACAALLLPCRLLLLSRKIVVQRGGLGQGLRAGGEVERWGKGV
jgi:hypothetical protein